LEILNTLRSWIELELARAESVVLDRRKIHEPTRDNHAGQILALTKIKALLDMEEYNPQFNPITGCTFNDDRDRMLNILILEDDPRRMEIFVAKLTPKHSIYWVDTADAAIKALAKDKFDVVFLDHDLGGEPPMFYGQNCDISDPNTGSEVVRWMVKDDYTDSPVVIVHSINTPAAENMEHKLTYAGFENHRIPFTKLVDTYLDDPNFLS